LRGFRTRLGGTMEHDREFLGPFRLVATMITKGEPSLIDAVKSALSCCEHVFIVHNYEAFDDVHKQLHDYALNKMVTYIPKKWEKDFSVARNHSLDLVRKYEDESKLLYCLWLDSDDIIDEKSAKGIRGLRLGKTNLPWDTREIKFTCNSVGAESVIQT
jgi:hypothetical protein